MFSEGKVPQALARWKNYKNLLADHFASSPGD
jgi:hypothetical protein